MSDTDQISIDLLLIDVDFEELWARSKPLNKHIDHLVKSNEKWKQSIDDEAERSKGKMFKEIRTKTDEKTKENVHVLQNIKTHLDSFAKSYANQVFAISQQEVSITFKEKKS
ncbi:hypothetical protein [Numidum massiliense]|uniref:hypothetical protein n=1 Tax=Numidum massiliense TaxID=1522315 RepID=UPI0006D55B0F|nr:hypothetical protein [Numidum massiliense]